jgi:hypothetical protein
MPSLHPPPKSAQRTRAVSRIAFAVALAGLYLALQGCDKCGDWFSQGATKSCRDESQVK